MKNYLQQPCYGNRLILFRARSALRNLAGFSGLNLFFIVTVFVQLVLATPAAAQTLTVTGRVTSGEDGAALPGVNVVVKGTVTGTVTDAAGAYTIDVPSSEGILSFSFIGFATLDVPLGGRSTIDVQLNTDVNELSEVIVTAIGIEREKKALGYAVTNVSAEQLQMRAENDPVRALQGKVAGVNIISQGGQAGAGTNITIRGSSSLLGNNQPLFVVDGVPFDNSTTPSGTFSNAGISSTRSFDLDPNNIESITVLKGGAAAALYGSRASNGVIVVTTKTGRSRSAKKGLEVSLNTSYNITEVANLPDYQTTYTGGNNFKFEDGNFGTWGAPMDVTHPTWQVPVNANVLLSIDPATGYGYVPHPYDQYNDPDDTPYFPQFANDSVLLRPHNTPKDFFSRGGLLETGLTLRSSTDKSSITAGISRSFEKGFVASNEAERISGNIGVSTTLVNKVNISGNLNYVRTQIQSPPIAGLATTGTSITERLLYTPPNINLKNLPFEDANGNMAFYRPDNDNPYWLSKYARNNEETNRFWGKMTVGYDLFEWLNVSYQFGANYYITQKQDGINPSANAFPTGWIRTDDFSNTELDGNFIITVDRPLSESVNLTSRVGHNWNKRKFDRQSFTGTTMIVPGIYDIDNFQSILPNGGGILERAYHAYYADMSFSYKDHLFLNLTGRNDRTSTLPIDSRSYYYGGASTSLIFTEAFNLNSRFLNTGKIRLGISRTGSDNLPYQTQLINYGTNMNAGGGVLENASTAPINFPFNGTNGVSIAAELGNPDLTPEFTTEWETGTELRLLNNRIGVDFTYYDRLTTDQIVPIDVPTSSGYSNRVANIGRVSNKGIEVGLDLTPLQFRNFSWNIYGTFTRNRNMVEELTDGLEEVIVGGFVGGAQTIVHRIGLPYGQIQGDVVAKDEEGNLLVDPGTGKLILNQRAIIGNPNPDHLLSVSNTFTYKGFSLGVLVTYQHGGEMYSSTYNQLYGRGVTTGTIPEGPRGRYITLVIPGFLGDPETGMPILDEDGNKIPNGTQLTVNDWYFINTFGSAGGDEFSVFDATNIRLREVTLGYTFPASMLSKTPFGSAHISFSGRNLFYKAVNFPEDLNFDPETGSIGVGNAQGIDFGVVPNPRRYGINLRLTF